MTSLVIDIQTILKKLTFISYNYSGGVAFLIKSQLTFLMLGPLAFQWAGGNGSAEPQAE